MDKVYVVTSGDYSEYSIEKIFSTREMADKYCAMENATTFYCCQDENDPSWGSFWNYECRVEEYPIDEAIAMCDTKSMKKRYIYKQWGEKEELCEHGTVYGQKSSIKMMSGYGVDVQLAVVVDYDMPEEKVKRIIYDEIAKYRATFKDMI